MKIVIPLLLSGAFLLVNCKEEMEQVEILHTEKLFSTDEAPEDWEMIDTEEFNLFIPPGWEHHKIQGIDSFVGEFVGDGVKLTYDYGWYSNHLANDDDPDHLVTWGTLDGFPAKLVVPTVEGNGVTGVYFPDLGGEIMKIRLEISGRDLSMSQQTIALKIFSTIHIKG